MTEGTRAPLVGQAVAITGRLASMTREEAIRHLVEGGACYAEDVDAATDLLVVGAGGAPLGADGRLTAKLRRAAEADHVEVVDEDELLARLGLTSGADRLYTAEQLGRILGVDRAEVRRWVRAGLLAPARELHRLQWFDFGQVATARALAQLRRDGVSPARLRRSLEQLGRWFDAPEKALAQLEALERSALVVRTPEGQLAEPSGQLHMDFETATPPPLPRIRAARPAPPDDPYEAALYHEDSGRLEAACDAYERALEGSTNRAEIAFNLGNARYLLGDLADAAGAFLRALEADPNFVEAWNNLGNVFDELDRPEEAVVAYRQALALAPNYADAHFNLGDTLAALGDAMGARRHWLAYLDEDPASETAAEVRSRLLRPVDAG